jgi:hypothetical protein
MNKAHVTNYQDLLKTIAIITMIRDHIGLYCFPEHIMLRAIGRSAMPIFCFFAGYNFSKPKAILWQLGLLLSVMWYISISIASLNMLVTIYLGQLYLYFMEKYAKTSEQDVLVQCILLLCLTPITCLILEYGTLAIAFMVIGRYYAKNNDDPGFMLLFAISLMIFSNHLFEFGLRDSVISSAAIAVACYALTARSYERPIPIDLKCISRNSLRIYYMNIAIFTIIRFNPFFPWM